MSRGNGEKYSRDVDRSGVRPMLTDDSKLVSEVVTEPAAGSIDMQGAA